jgi:cytochrome c
MSAASSFRTLRLRHRRALAARTRWSWRSALRVGTVAGFLALCFSPSAFAADVAALITQKRCDACHDLTATRIGPPFVAIALRHRADKDNMIEVLARKIVLGGGGNWGVVPMVPNEHVTLDEARTMAKWILERPAS